MTSLSRLIKSYFATPDATEKKVISIKMFNPEKLDNSENSEPSIFDSCAERQRLMEEAILEADRIRQEAMNQMEAEYEKLRMEKEVWQQEKIRISQEAEQVGFQAGLENGRVQGYKEYSDRIQFAQNVVETSKEDYRKHLEASETTILNLGIKVAEKIIGKSLGGNETEFLSYVKRALKEAREYKEIQLHIHPTRYTYLLAEKEELLAIFPREIDLYIYPNEDVAENSCLIESDNGRVDASIDSQLSQIKERLMEIMESE